MPDLSEGPEKKSDRLVEDILNLTRNAFFSGPSDRSAQEIVESMDIEPATIEEIFGGAQEMLITALAPDGGPFRSPQDTGTNTDGSNVGPTDPL